MLGGRVIATIVPARDEGPFIAKVLETMPPFVDRVVVVDDASEDDTVARAEQARCSAAVEVIRHTRNRGVGAAIVTGYRSAMRAGADVLAVMAGDGQMDPSELERVVTPIVMGRAEYVKGNRLRHQSEWRRMPSDRLVGSLVLSRLTSWAVGISIGDSQCGYTALASTLARELDLESLWPRFGYPNDLLGTVVRSGGRVVEVDVTAIYGDEVSHLRARHVVPILYLIGRARLRRALV